MWGLRVSRLLDLEAVSRSKSDTPTRAKNCEAMIRKWEGKDKKNRGRSLRATEPQRTAGILEGWKNQRAEIRTSEPRRSEGRGQRSELQSLRNQGAEKNNFPFLFDNIVVFIYYVVQLDNIIF